MPEELTKREIETVTRLLFEEASRLYEKSKDIQTAPERRVLREQRNEMYDIIRKLLTDKTVE